VKRVKLLTLGICALLVFAFSMPSFADAEGAITIICKYEEDNISYLKGDELSLTQIATATEDKGEIIYTTLPAYKDQDCDWEKQTAESLRNKASLLAERVTASTTLTTGEFGEVVFGGLKPGVYLIARSKIAKENTDYVEEPLLILLPQDDTYYITAEIKIAKKTPEEAKPEETEEDIDSEETEDDEISEVNRKKTLIEKVKTGDYFDIYTYMICFAIGATILLMSTGVSNITEKLKKKK